MSDAAPARNGKFADVPSWKWIVGILIMVVAFFVALWMRSVAENLASLANGQREASQRQNETNERLAAATQSVARNLAEVDASRRERIAQLEGEQKSMAVWRTGIDNWCLRVETKLDKVLTK